MVFAQKFRSITSFFPKLGVEAKQKVGVTKAEKLFYGLFCLKLLT